jgi:hypothetical protein
VLVRVLDGSASFESFLLLAVAFLAFGSPRSRPQDSATIPLNTSGQIVVDGHSTPYLIRHLPISSFPDLPPAIQTELATRDCIIPQTYEAHQPENVTHASLERPGSSDWAVLCSAQGTVSLMVFFGNGSGLPFTLASAPEIERLQRHDPSGVLGVDWGIDSASPQQVHEAQASMDPRPPLLDHDALADTLVDRRTVYRFYLKNAWIVLEMRD